MSIARAPDAHHRSIAPRNDASYGLLLAVVAVLAGTCAWMWYLRADLVLSHYDAKAHLVVARRVIDNLTPGWQQIGAVWLPLPHLLLLLPVQHDLLYRTGFAGSALSLISLGISAYAIAAFVHRASGSRVAAAAGVTLLVGNPNLLYLYTTPMTEPLLLAVTLLLVLWTFDWIVSGSDVLPPRLGWLLAAAAWTRYEAWAVIGGAGILMVTMLVRRGVPLRQIATRAAAFAAWPVVAIGLFLVNSRVTIGAWFVSDGFFVPDPTYAHQALKTAWAIVEGTQSLSGGALVFAASASVGVVIWQSLLKKDGPPVLMAVALLGAAALPFVAFYDGHPFRIRYMTPLVAAGALLCGLGLGRLPRRWQPPAALALVTLALVQAPPLSGAAPMVREAQLDRPAGRARTAVSECLATDYRGEKVLMSMGSLAHYMQELSWYGFALRDFVHEGNGIIWEVALESGPASTAGWMMVEEVAEGGDVLAQRIRQDPRFTAGMTSVCAGGGVTLYRRGRRPGDIAQPAS